MLFHYNTLAIFILISNSLNIYIYKKNRRYSLKEDLKIQVIVLYTIYSMPTQEYKVHIAIFVKTVHLLEKKKIQGKEGKREIAVNHV